MQQTHNCSINTDTPSPFARPSTHTTPEPDNNSEISGPSHISGPSLPPKELEVVQNSKIPTPDPLPQCPSYKPCSVPHCQCPYTRPPLTKPSNTHFSPISGPLPPAELCLDRLLMHLVSLNGTLELTLKDNIPTSMEPSSSTTSTSRILQIVHVLHLQPVLIQIQRAQVTSPQFQPLAIDSYAPDSPSAIMRPC